MHAIVGQPLRRTSQLHWGTMAAVNRKYFVQLVALSALWGASFPMLRIASPLLGPGMLACLRIAIASLTLALIMRWVGQRWPWAHWRELALLGLLSVAAPFLLFSWAATKLPSGYVALLNTTAVVFGTLASAWMKEDTVTLRKLFGGVVGLGGVGLVVRLGPVEPTTDVLLGTGAAILASLSFGLSTPLMKRATRRMEPLAIAGPVHACAFLFLLPTGLFYWPQAQFTPLAMAITLVLGVITSGLAFWAHLRIMRHMTPVAAMSPMFFIPMFGVAWGHLILGEALGSGIYLGGALVLLGAALVTGYNPLRRDPIARALPPG